MIKNMEIIPALITEDDDAVNDIEELKNKFEKIRPHLANFGNWIQIDFTDGKFVKSKTNVAASDFSYFTALANIDFHLMISEPEADLGKWLAIKPARITVHVEATAKIPEIVKKCREAGAEVGLALNPETANLEIEPWLREVDLVLYLGVHPGQSSQEFVPQVLPKIKELRLGHADVKIGVDGGMNPATGKLCEEAGADILIVGSYLFKSKDIGKAIKDFIN